MQNTFWISKILKQCVTEQTNKKYCALLSLFLLFLKSDLWPKYLTCDDKSFTTSVARCNPGLHRSASSLAQRYHWKRWGGIPSEQNHLFLVHETMNRVELNAVTYTVTYNSNNSLFGDFCLGNKPAVAIQKPHEGLRFPPPSPWPQALSVYRSYQLWGFFVCLF